MKFQLRKFDDELQIVYGEVYAPNVPDAHGDFMTEVEVRKMAHKFMEKQNMGAVDTNHDNVENKSVVVESFIARPDDPVYIADAWCVGVHVPDAAVWKKIKSGELNGFSFEAMVRSKDHFIEIEVPDEIIGVTQKHDDHDHTYMVKFDDEGNFLGGKTNTVNGHFHEIIKGTVTEKSQMHAHRYSFMEALTSEEAVN